MKIKQMYLVFFLTLSFLNLQSQITFTDVTAAARVAFNAEVVESLAWGDYDNDGDEDLFLSTNGLNKLMKNDGNDVFTDVSIDSGLTHSSISTGCAFGDLDNDGDLDLFVVTNSSGVPDLLYENKGAAANYTFQSIENTVSGISDFSSQRGMSFFDFNRDGLLDLYVNANGNDIVYKNLGNLTFEEIASSIGVLADNTGVGSVPTDINNDGWIDVFAGNRSSTQNKLFVNNGSGSFIDKSTFAGITDIGLGMGVISFDYDNDLDMDLYWTTWPKDSPVQPNVLYQNQGNETFLNKTFDTGTLDESGWGISANAGDIDNDRFEDFFISNGFSVESSGSVLFRNINGINFQDITFSVLGSSLNWDARGVAFADYDNDGDLDVCLTGGAGVDTKLWRNDTVNPNNWVSFRLEGVASNKSAIGARIEVTANSIITVKEVSGGAGRGSFNSLPVEFGLGNATAITNVKIIWPSGFIENFNAISINQINNIKEGDSTLSANAISFDNLLLNTYPNPFKNSFSLDLSLFKSISNIKIYNILGVLIYEENSPANENIKIEIDNNFTGLLFLSVQSNNATITHKMVKY